MKKGILSENRASRKLIGGNEEESRGERGICSVNRIFRKQPGGNEEENREKKASRRLIFGLLLISLCACLGQALLKHSGGSGAKIIITVNGGKVYEGIVRKNTLNGEVDITDVFSEASVFNRDGSFLTVKTEMGCNILEVGTGKDGAPQIRCLEADCSNQICVDTGWICSDTETIVCLPHRLTVRILPMER